MNIKAVVSLLVILSATYAGGGLRAAEQDVIAWSSSMPKASDEAQSAGKPILLVLYADYCEYCHQMEREAFLDSRATLLSDEYMPCRLNGENDGKQEIARYHVKMYPYQAVIRGDTNLAETTGYMSSDQFVRMLALGLPPDRVALLAQNGADAASLAKITVIDSVKGDLAGAATAYATLEAMSPTPPKAYLAAAAHALGLACAQASEPDQAVRNLKAAELGLDDSNELVELHFLAADNDIKIRQIADAGDELTAIESMKSASRDDKRNAARRIKQLSK
jgi:thioredoxin-related protein